MRTGKFTVSERGQRRHPRAHRPGAQSSLAPPTKSRCAHATRRTQLVLDVGFPVHTLVTATTRCFSNANAARYSQAEWESKQKKNVSKSPRQAGRSSRKAHRQRVRPMLQRCARGSGGNRHDKPQAIVGTCHTRQYAIATITEWFSCRGPEADVLSGRNSMRSA